MHDKSALVAAITGLVILLTGCVPDLGSSKDEQDLPSSWESQNSSSQSDPGERATIQNFGLPMVSDEEWSDTAVRKVLHTFAYGGHATDEQIATWADMSPAQAIAEILTFDEHNLKLSPVTAANYDALDRRDGTLRGLGEFWSSDHPQNGVPAQERDMYRIDNWSIELIWVLAATSRGLNPFRQKIGLWETNYHMVVNLNASVEPMQLVEYYDSIMEALEADKPYQDVMTIAATSSAIATQYGHFNNQFRNGYCFCNEDFAREYYQLFFGVLGEYDADYHETVTIKSTANAFTDMSRKRDQNGNFTNELIFGTQFHYPGLLEMLGTQYWGANMPDRIEQLSQDAINHYESLNNLPVKIIRDLADDNLDETKIAQIRSAWQSMQPKNLLSFLRTYAISTLFHSKDRIKHLTTIDRHILLANKIALSNEDGYLYLLGVLDYVDEDVRAFRPLHNVFGNQTGIEAASSPGVFRNNYNRLTENYHRYRTASGTKLGRTWTRNWASLIPVDETGQYKVGDVAEWLWNRFMADGLKNFGMLERAHVYAFLSRDQDLLTLVSPEDTSRVITAVELKTDPVLKRLIDELAAENLALGSADLEERRRANERIGQAINFIAGTPYIFVQKGV